MKGIQPQELLWLQGMHLEAITDDCGVITLGNSAFGH